jgi:hypothetical protein
MVTKLTDSFIGLEPGLAISLERRHNQIIRCIENQLWLTQEGLADDVVLNAGETFALAPQGKIVIEAIGGEARYALEKPTTFIEYSRHRLATFMHHIGDAIEGAKPTDSHSCSPTT